MWYALSTQLNHDNTEQRRPSRWFVVGKTTKTATFLPRPSSLSPLPRASFSLDHFLRQNVIIRFSWLHVLIFVMYLRDVVMTVLGADVIYTWQTSQVIGQVQVLFSRAAEGPTRCLLVLEKFQWQIHTLFEVGVEYISGGVDVCVSGDMGRRRGYKIYQRKTWKTSTELEIGNGREMFSYVTSANNLNTKQIKQETHQELRVYPISKKWMHRLWILKWTLHKYNTISFCWL